LGDEFLDEVEEGLNRIRQFPLMWPVYDDVYRRCLLKRFPFGLIYRIQDAENIIVIAVAHLHRLPGFWKDRS
jgi:hypothetical protein